MMMASTSAITVIETVMMMIIGIVSCRPDSDFGFPIEHEGPIAQQNAQMKMPLFVPTRCQENELLYPGDYNNDWVCDCKPGFLFYPANSKCYGPYYQGPCQPGFMLILKPNSYIPECVINPCRIGDGYVHFRNGCYKLETPGPCAQPELSIVLSVNVSNLQLDCVKIGAPVDPLADRFGGEDDVDVVVVGPTLDVAEEFCGVGSRRWQEKKCPPKSAE